jgi:hypothetical protein
MEGYLTTQGDQAAHPVMDAGAQTSVTLVNSSTVDSPEVGYLKADGQSGASNVGFSGQDQENSFVSCEAVDCDGTSGIGFNSGNCIGCKAQNCVTGFASIVLCTRCESEDCTTGFNIGTQQAVNCLAYGGTTGFVLNSTAGTAICCSAIGATTGFSFTQARTSAFCCVATDCTTGYSVTGTRAVLLCECYAYNNTTNVSGTPMPSAAIVTILTADPWVDSATDDYRPNNTAGGGASLRAAGIGLYSQTNNTDVGAVQHSDPAGGAAGGIFY